MGESGAAPWAERRRFFGPLTEVARGDSLIRQFEKENQMRREFRFIRYYYYPAKGFAEAC